jgi:hypothetical protein
MDGQNIIRAFLFIVFFSVGATALSGSILFDDVIQYYRNQRLLEDARESLNQLESLNADHDVLLTQLGEDPNLFKRIAPVTLGVGREEPNTVYPIATIEQLAAARKALAKQPAGRQWQTPEGVYHHRSADLKVRDPNAAVPVWLARCGEPRRRLMLFLTGAGLVLVSFVCFGSRAKESTEVTHAGQKSSRAVRMKRDSTVGT